MVTMQFIEFSSLSPQAVRELAWQRARDELGVAMPFNGTRRWYLAAFNKPPEALYDDDYSIQSRKRTWEIVDMLFADGIKTVYSPMVGRALIERGPEYMAFAARALAWLADDEALRWYRERNISAAAYGDLELLPPEVAAAFERTKAATAPGAQYFVRWGIFADQPMRQIVARAMRLHERTGELPDDGLLARDYYSFGEARFARADIWIGTEQPTVYDVPLVLHGGTALYFLQFPTPYLDLPLWRRILYDYLFIRGDDESLQPDNLTSERRIIGLGERTDGNWTAC